MSSYYSQSDHEEQQEQKPLFGWQYSIASSQDVITEWKNRIHHPTTYLQTQQHILKQQHLHLRSSYQVRVLAFAQFLLEQLQQLNISYLSAYQQTQHHHIPQLDNQLATFIPYFFDLDHNTTDINGCQQFQNRISSIYQQLEQATLYCTHPSTIHRIIYMLDTNGEGDHLLKVSYGGTHSYYKKQIKHIATATPQHKHLFEQTHNLTHLLNKLTKMLTDSTITESNRFRYAAVMKGQYFASVHQPSLKADFIRESLHDTFCFSASEVWDEERYENLCAKLMTAALDDPEYIPEMLTVSPEIVRFEKRQHTKHFLTLHTRILEAMLSLPSQKEINICASSLEQLLDTSNFELYLSNLTDFCNKSKKLYSLQDPQLHSLFSHILEQLKTLYFSFTTQQWVIPITAFVHLNTKFFSKHSECQNTDIQTRLADMVKTLTADMMPNRTTIRDGVLVVETVDRLEYLWAIHSYSKHITNDDIYLDLPDIQPYDLPTALLFVMIVSLKLKYHEPSGQQKVHYTKMLDMCINKYKIEQKFKWYNETLHLEDRQKQFAMMLGLQPWGRQLLQKILNVRDERYLQKILQHYHSNRLTIEEVIESLKYSVGMKVNLSTQKVKDEHLFSIIEVMKMNFQVYFSNIFDLCLEDELMINQLHVCLLFYNTRLKEMPGSELYQQIVLKIVVPWMRISKKFAHPFRNKYPQFFQSFVVNEGVLAMGDELIDCLVEGALEGQQIVQKVQFFNKVVREGTIGQDSGREFLSKLISIYHVEMEAKAMLGLICMFLQLMNRHPPLLQQFSLACFINQELLTSPIKLQQILTALKNKPSEIQQPVLRTMLETVPNIYNAHQSIPLHNLVHIIKLATKCINLQFIYLAFSKIEHHEDQHTLFIQGLITLCESIQNPTIRESSMKIWKMLQEKIPHLHNKQPLAQLLGEKLISKVTGEIKRSTENKDKLEEVRILQQIIWNVDCQIDDILEFTDLSNLLLQTKPKQHQFLLRWILAKEYRSEKHQILHKGISKLPVLKQCSECAVEKLSEPETMIYPEHIYKLILINNKYASAKTEQFILKNIEKFDEFINIRIHQKYLIRDLKKSLAQIPNSFLASAFQSQQTPYIEQANLVFKKLICLPITEMTELYVRNMQIEEENEEWKTQSEGSADEKKTGSRKDERYLNAAEEEFMMVEDLNDLDGSQFHSDYDDDEDEQEDEDIEDYDHQRPRIVELFYREGQPDLPFYKDYVKARQIINIIVQDNYLESLEKYRSNPQFQECVLKIVKVIELIVNEEVRKSIIRKIPPFLFIELKRAGLSKDQDLTEQLEQREEEKGKPRFDNEIVSDDEDMSEQRYEFDEESNSQSIEDHGDEWEQQSDEDAQQQIEEDLCEQEMQSQVNVPDFNNIFSTIEEKIEGNQFTDEEKVKYMEVALFQLFVLSSSEIKLKAINTFYKDLLKTKMKKMFVDSLLTLARIDQYFKNIQHMDKLLLKGISPRRALDNLLYIIHSNYQDQNQEIYRKFDDQGGELLPTATKILNFLPVQDNILTLLNFHCKIKHPKTHLKINNFLSKLYKLTYSMSKKTAKILTINIYRSQISSALWKKLQSDFQISISKKIKLYTGLQIYCGMLREDIERTLQIIHEKQQDIPINYKVKILENLLKLHVKKIKHFYFWNKDFISQLEQLSESERKKLDILKKTELIRLVQLMFFYLKFLKDTFYEKIEESKFNQIVWLSKNIIEIPFMYLKTLKQPIENWKSATEVNKFFNVYKYGEYKFPKLTVVCNLIMQFLMIPTFSIPLFKDIIIPYFMKNPEQGHLLPLVFKAPAIPEQPEGQRLFVTRQCSFDMSFYQLNANSILVEYHEEEGSDYGGMVRELMMGWQGMGIGEQYCFLGKLLGISFKKSIPYGGKFDIQMAIAITSFTPTLAFVEQYDPKLYKNLCFILDNDVDDLDLTFTIHKQKYGILHSYDLKPNGHTITVTNFNKKQYINLYIEKEYSCGREWQLSELRVGFFSIVNRKYAGIFHPLELIHKVRGQEVHDYLKLKKKAKYESGYTSTTPIIRWLWQIISKFNQEQMNRFIQFLTGAPKISIYDPHFKFIIEKNYTDNEQKLPVAHTCFNTLDLPEYKTKQILERKLKIAIMEGNDNFGLL